ncbi:hypothetical protein [Streptomyces sp. NPDC055107]
MISPTPRTITTAEMTVIQVERSEWSLCHSERRIRGAVIRYWGDGVGDGDCDGGDGDGDGDGDGGEVGLGLGEGKVGWVVVMPLLR